MPCMCIGSQVQRHSCYHICLLLCAVTKLTKTLQASKHRFDAAADQDHVDGPSFVGDGPGHAMQHSEMPMTESLQDTVKRILPLWHDSIAPAITSGQKVLIVAHGNSIRVRPMMITCLPIAI